MKITKERAKNRSKGSSIREWEQRQGLFRVWDCGKLKWKWDKKQ